MIQEIPKDLGGLSLSLLLIIVLQPLRLRIRQRRPPSPPFHHCNRGSQQCVREEREIKDTQNGKETKLYLFTDSISTLLFV